MQGNKVDGQRRQRHKKDWVATLEASGSDVKNCVLIEENFSFKVKFCIYVFHHTSVVLCRRVSVVSIALVPRLMVCLASQLYFLIASFRGIERYLGTLNPSSRSLLYAKFMQMFIGDGAKLVRDAFQLAKEKSPCIIFIDEIDAIGTKRFDREAYFQHCCTSVGISVVGEKKLDSKVYPLPISEVSGDREVQRTMLELLNQLDGFSSDDRIKVRP
eukprot:Gb_25629 [translate_table: standard]